MRVFLLFFAFLCAPHLWGASVSLETSAESVRAGENFGVDVRFNVPDGSYVYYKNPGESGLPTALKWALPPGFKLSGESWPEPERVSENGLSVLVYKKGFTVRAKFNAPPALEAGKAEIRLDAEWLKCTKSLCEPQDAHAEIAIGTVAGSSGSLPGKAILAAVLGAFAGGMILNLMPCVFPVIGLKILSFAKDASSSRTAALKNAAFYSAGVVASFLLLALALAWLKGAGSELGWGFQLQNPAFVAVLAFLFFAMALAFAGLFEIGTGLASLGAKAAGNGASSFLSGVLAVLVASPCTAPFMGASLGFALASDSGTTAILMVFTFLGLGMAFPYVLLSALPQVARLLPKPGAWMETFKQFLAFPLFATLIWLLWIFARQAGAGAAAELMFSLLALAFALWIFGKWSTPAKPKKIRLASGLAALLIALSSIAWGMSAAKPQALEAAPNAWSEAKVEELRKEGKIVYVDFTASWCLTCIANKKAVLDTEATRELFKERDVAFLEADWTNKDPAITRKLAEFGRSGVPLNIVYPPDPGRQPIMLPEILTRAALIEAIDKAQP